MPIDFDTPIDGICVPNVAARPGRLTGLLHRARTEGGSPVRQALAIAAGLFIGCTPFMGFHLVLTLVVGRVFRLNRLKMYLASNISNPFVAPVLFAVEIQLGAWLRTGRMYSLDTLHAIRLKGLALDVLLGCLPVALTLAAIGFVLTYVMFRTGREHGETAATLDRAAERYLSIGIGAWELAHGKMRMDPVYDQVLQAGILPPHGTIVDIGCGMGYMLAAAAAAGTNARLIGIELRSRIARRAASALAGDAEIYSADVLAAPLPACDAVLLFDVLHMMPSGDQRRLLSCIRAALRPGGVIVIREANRGGGWRFILVRSGNWTRGLFEGRWRPHFKFRSTTEWEQELATAGFSVTIPMFDENQLLANFLMFARPIAADRLETIRTPVDVWPSAATR